MVRDAKSTAGYDAAHSGIAYFVRPAELVRVAGPDAFDFLQRQVTNDVRAAAPDDPQVNVLTDATARIIDAFALLRDEAGYSLLSRPGRGGALADYLRGKIFFMDDVTVELAGEALAAVEIYGPDVASAAHAASDAAAVLVETGAFAPVLLVPQGHRDALEEALQAAGAAPLTTAEADLLRIEQGWPEAGAELDGRYTPLEVGLASAVSDTKGCYTGQEVLARQVTYDKVTRALVGISLGEPVSPGADVLAEGKRVGAITSSGVSPTHGAIALAVVRRPFDTPGTVVQAAADGRSADGVVRQLPFGRVE